MSSQLLEPLITGCAIIKVLRARMKKMSVPFKAFATVMSRTANSY